MRYIPMSFLLVLTTGLTLMPTGPLVAADAAAPPGDCQHRLSQIERRLADADVAARRQAQIQQIIDGARTLGQLGDAKRCTDLANQLDGLLQSLSDAGNIGSGGAATAG